MRVQPKTEAEVASAGLLKPGVYDFEVAEAQEQTSKAGNDMIKLQLDVYDTDGRKRTVFDYLLDTEGFEYKIRHFADSIGMLANYEKGDLPANEMYNRTGKCKIAIQADKTGNYPDKNVIRDYVKSAGSNGAAKPEVASSLRSKELDDEIPF